MPGRPLSKWSPRAGVILGFPRTRRSPTSRTPTPASCPDQEDGDSGSSCYGAWKRSTREWLLICAGHQLLKLFRFGSRLPGKVLGSGPTRNINESPGTVSASILERLSGHWRLTPAGIAVGN